MQERRRSRRLSKSELRTSCFQNIEHNLKHREGNDHWRASWWEASVIRHTPELPCAYRRHNSYRYHRDSHSNTMCFYLILEICELHRNQRDPLHNRVRDRLWRTNHCNVLGVEMQQKQEAYIIDKGNTYIGIRIFLCYIHVTGIRTYSSQTVYIFLYVRSVLSFKTENYIV